MDPLIGDEDGAGSTGAEASRLRKRRAGLKGQITRIFNWINSAEELTTGELVAREAAADEAWGRFLETQEMLEAIIHLDGMEREMMYREEVENVFFALKGKIGTLKEDTSQEVNSSETKFNITFTPYSEQESFSNFINRVSNYIKIKNLSHMKVATLIHVLPPVWHEKLHQILLPESPFTKNFEEIVSIVKEFVEPTANTLTLQHKFVCRVQQRDESVASYAIELKKAANSCKFECECKRSVADLMLKMQFIRGLTDNEIRVQLLQTKEEMSYKEIIKLACNIEAAKLEGAVMEQARMKDMFAVNSASSQRTVRDRHQAPNRVEEDRGGRQVQGRPKVTCFRCGKESHTAAVCFHRNAVCRYCKKMGHLEVVCMKKKQAGVKMCEQEEPEEKEANWYSMNSVGSKSSDKFMIQIKINGKNFTMELDTGAALSLISQEDFTKLGLGLSVEDTSVTLRTYTGERIRPVGAVKVKVEFKDHTFVGKLYIIDQKVDPVFGRDWLKNINISLSDINVVELSVNEKLNKLLEKYEVVFNKSIGEIPKIRGQYYLKEGCKPIFIKPRPVPYALKEKIEQELDRLEGLEVITKVDFSEWGTPIVPVVKPNGSIRLCADYKVTLNKVIKEEPYPIPRIEDIYASMHGAKYFCSLDISNAYLHMVMEEESAVMQTLSTHKGLYRVNRLMFGVKTAPQLWNRFMDRVVLGMKGVHFFFDDVVVHGENEQQVLERLEAVFKRFETYNLKVNKEKCHFFQKNIKYLGHVISEMGIDKAEDKVKCLLEAKRPENIQELRTLLGLANYYNRFIPNLATLLHPLNKLLQKANAFKWNEECEKSFQRVKEEIASERILAHYDPGGELTLATDASPVGLGAVLSHRYADGTERPIAFASRSLTRAEVNYSQIDKEALAIYWGLKKFFAFCYGRKFTLITDHKPLISIFNPSSALPSLSATRILHYSLFLSGFDYQIEYRGTKLHGNADYLSRFPVDRPNCMLGKDESEMFQLNQISMLPIRAEEIAKSTEEDVELREVLKALTTGVGVSRLGWAEGELTLQDGCILRGSRVMIPGKLRHKILSELHIGHLGMTRMKRLARRYCYWRGIDKDIERMVRDCVPCCQKVNNPPVSEPHPWAEATAPWQRVHIDFAEPSAGTYYLIIVDSHTKWMEVVPTKDTTSAWCERELARVFTTFGIPLTLVSDNGRQFTSASFQRFLNTYGITHRTTAPYHPQSNGLAERMVQTVKKHLQAMKSDPGDKEEKLRKLLVQLRNSPNASGRSAYEAMFGRPMRTRLDLLVRTVGPHNSLQEGEKREFEVGDRVQYRLYGPRGSTKWGFGRVAARLGRCDYRISDGGLLLHRHLDQLRNHQAGGED